MKHLLFSTLSVLLLFSCNMESGEETDVEEFSTGLSANKIYLSDLEGNEITEVTFGQMIQMNFDHVEGFDKEQDQVTVDFMFLFRNQQKDTILFIDYGEIEKGVYDVKADQYIDLYTYATIEHPLFSGNTYLFKTGVKDHKSDKVLEGEVDLKVVKNNAIRVENEGFTYKEIAIFNTQDKKYLLNDGIQKGVPYEMYIFGLEGFELVGENAMVGVSLSTKDADGNIISGIPDLAAEQTEGMVFEEINAVLSVDFDLDENSGNAPTVLEVVVWDKNGASKMTIQYDVAVVQ